MMSPRGALLVGLLLAATAWGSSADPNLTVCSCANDECRCESTPPGAEAEDTQQDLEQTKEVTQWWDGHISKAHNTSCSCFGAACYCSRTADRGDETHPQQHSSCLCTGAAGEACHCGHSNTAVAQPRDVSATTADEAELMGETKEMSKAMGQKRVVCRPHRHPVLSCVRICNVHHIPHCYHHCAYSHCVCLR